MSLADAFRLRDSPSAAGAVRLGRYVFKPATTPGEHEQLHRLNYLTFVRELPQHADPGQAALVDKFHDKNLYFVALDGSQVVGMLSVHDRPPFSITDKLADPSVLAALGPRPLEVRLLAVRPEHRHGPVFGGLGYLMLRHAQRHGYSHLLISGVADRIRMYERIGFRALGPPVRDGAVTYVPMVAHVAGMPEHIELSAGRIERRLEPGRGEGANGTSRKDGAHGAHDASVGEDPDGTALSPERRAERAVSLTPGQAQLSAEVAEALAQPGIDHRSREFTELYQAVRQALGRLAGGLPCALFCGSGTLANDVVAVTLAADRRLRRGLVLVNGEFGRRLVRQARRAGLQPGSLEWAWGQPWDLSQVEALLEDDGRIDWVWAVHLESSTGLLNDLPGLVRLCSGRGVAVCVDAISSLGAVPVDLSGCRLATGVANKALGGVAGLSMVFASPRALDGVPSESVPSYLDLAETLRTPGPRFTLASPLLVALARALQPYADAEACARRFREYEQLGSFVRRQLRGQGLSPLVEPPLASPVITTFAPPAGLSGDALRDLARAWGFTLGGGSGYLRERGWLQIATLGAVQVGDCARLFERLGSWRNAHAS